MRVAAALRSTRAFEERWTNDLVCLAHGELRTRSFSVASRALQLGLLAASMRRTRCRSRARDLERLCTANVRDGAARARLERAQLRPRVYIACAVPERDRADLLVKRR